MKQSFQNALRRDRSFPVSSGKKKQPAKCQIRIEKHHSPYDFFIESSVRSMYHPFKSTADFISFKTKTSFCFFMPAKKGVFQSETPSFYFCSSTGCICLPCTALSTAAGSRLKSDTTEFGLFSGSSCAMGTK